MIARVRARVRGGRCCDDRGAVLLEFTLMAPLLVVLLMGITDYGFALRGHQSLANASRAAARVASNTSGGGGNMPYADHTTLTQIAATQDTLDADLLRVVIYDATNASGAIGDAYSQDGAPPQDCIDDVPGPGGAACNIYDASMLDAFDPLDKGPFGCDPGDWDTNWCPTTRETDQDAGADFVGVWIETDHHLFTGFFGDDITMTSSAVFRIEPDVER